MFLNKDMLLKTFRKIPTIETPRLLLRCMKPCDCEDMYEYSCRADTTKYLTWSEHESKQFTHRYLEYLQKQYSHGEFYDWAVTLKENGKMIGTCGFTSFDLPNNSAEVGYVINPSYWGKGYASEALLRVLDFGFMKLNLHRMQARYMDGNNASRRVMDKCGMRYEGTSISSMYIKEQYATVHTCAILSEEYIKKYVTQN